MVASRKQLVTENKLFSKDKYNQISFSYNPNNIKIIKQLVTACNEDLCYFKIFKIFRKFWGFDNEANHGQESLHG